MIRDQILSKPVWRHFLDVDGVYGLPLPALLAADDLFDAIRRVGTVDPTDSDYAIWAQGACEDDPTSWLENLRIAAAVILPSEAKKIAAAQAILGNRSTIEIIPPVPQTAPQASWDPCARPVGTRWPRKVSVCPWELPEPWQVTLRHAAQGRPRDQVAAPSRDILQRTREKLCQLTWSARRAGLTPDLTEEVMRQYLEDLEARLRVRDHGIRWATMRATVEDIYRFARYTGTLAEVDLIYLRKRLSRYEFFERGQDALKFAALLATGNTTLSVLDRADKLLEQAALEECPKARHRLRNAGAILGLYSIAPLRNADAELVLGKTLLWESGTWVIDTPIRKTMAHSPDHLVIPLEPEFARYVDAAVMGDFEPRNLPTLRQQIMRFPRPLILHPNGRRPCPSHIPRIFKQQTGNSFTTTRTMLHTDQAISRGAAGTRDAMVMAHQNSPRTALKYQQKSVRQVAITRVQDSAAARRTAAMPPELREALRMLDINAGKSG